MRAFFFSGAKYIGHDDPATSNDIRVVKGEKGAVTLSYRVSTGGRARRSPSARGRRGDAHRSRPAVHGSLTT